MVYSFNDLRCKEIINVKNGARLLVKRFSVKPV